TGFTGASGARRMSEYSQLLMFPKAVLPLEGEPALTGLRLTADAYAAETHVRDIRPVVSPLNERPRMIRQILESCGVRTGRVGISLGGMAPHSPGELDCLGGEVSDLGVVGGGGPFRRLAMNKTPGRNRLLASRRRNPKPSFPPFAARISRRMTESDLIFEM